MKNLFKYLSPDIFVRPKECICYLYNKHTDKDGTPMDKQEKLALYGIVKDEKQCYIDEWFDVNSKNFDLIVVYNNGSDFSVPSQYASKTIVKKYHGTGIQMPALQEVTRFFRRQNVTWFLSIDFDELLNNVDFSRILNSPHDVGCVSINWLIYGHCNVQKADNRPQREKFKTPSSNTYPNRLVKSFVRPDSVCAWGDPHVPILKRRYRQLHINGKEMKGPFYSPPDYTCGWIDHYFIRSIEEWPEKVARGRADTGDRRERDVNGLFA